VSKAALVPAFVLHHHPYGDTSLLLELFTLTHGRMGVVARGARAPRARQRGLLQPFRPLLVSWSGRGELGTLTAVELSARSEQLPAGRLMSAYYVNELLLKLLQRQDAHTEIFSLYATTLSGLAASSRREERVLLRRFEKQLLEALGYGLNFTHDFSTGLPVRADSHYHFRPDAGPEMAGVADGGQTVAGDSLLALSRGEFADDRHLDDARRLLGGAIEQHLGGRTLRTREVARATHRRLAGATAVDDEPQ
jgi:DNA repair protein RecO (recombination protein O)